MRRPGTAHSWHFLLTLVSFGAWVLVWLFAAAVNASRSFRYTQCGTAIDVNRTRAWALQRV